MIPARHHRRPGRTGPEKPCLLGDPAAGRGVVEAVDLGFNVAVATTQKGQTTEGPTGHSNVALGNDVSLEEIERKMGFKTVKA